MSREAAAKAKQATAQHTPDDGPWVVVVDGWYPDGFYDTPEEAQRRADYCNRNYLGRHTVAKGRPNSAALFMAAIEPTRGRQS